MLRNNRTLLTGLGLGIGLMYFMDPGRGRRRRAMVRDKIGRATRASTNAVSAVSLDLAHRAEGLVARARGVWHRGPVDDDVLVERVRAKLGRLVSHPHAIEVHAADGRVHLRGPVLESELPKLIHGIARVRGVRDVLNALDVHRSAGNIPALQRHASSNPAAGATGASRESNPAWQRG